MTLQLCRYKKKNYSDGILVSNRFFFFKKGLIKLTCFVICFFLRGRQERNQLNKEKKDAGRKALGADWSFGFMHGLELLVFVLATHADTQLDVLLVH